MRWKQSVGRKPLILRGVRQAGKTYLLEKFGKQAFQRYHIINFEKQQQVAELFDKDLVPARIVDGLRFHLGCTIDVNNDLLIFDEIQACPRAITSLKYFCEDMPELALCSAGSLLGLRLNESSFPVGKVDMMHLYPMNFSEFLHGIGDEVAANTFDELSVDSELDEVAHQHLWQRLTHYFVTGGLPEVVSTFAKHDNLYDATEAVRQAQELLINGYYADIAKHSGKVNAMHIDRVWRDIPKQLSQTQEGSVGKFKFKGILPNINRYAQLVDVIDWLEAAELLIKVPIVDVAKLPISAYAKDNRFKLLMFDVGILGAISGLEPKTILDYDYGSYKGYFAENFVAQQLLLQKKSFFSWQLVHAEIEFLLQDQGAIVPLEVKAGKKTQAKSLQKFIDKFHPANSYILSGNNFQQGGFAEGAKLYRLPLYLAEKLFTNAPKPL